MIVRAPHWLATGGDNAALRLSAALREMCDIEVARMAEVDGTRQEDDLVIRDFRCTNPLSLLTGAVPSELQTLFFRAAIPKLIASRQYDLVHIHNPIPALEMKRIARSCVAHRVPYVVSTHGLVELSSKGSPFELGFLRRVGWTYLVDNPFRYVLHQAASVMALSPADVPILEDLGCRSERISMVPNGVVLPAKKASPAEIELVCRKFDLPFPKTPEVPVCTFLANHTKNKGVLVLLEAFARCDRPFRLIAAGSRRDYVDYDHYSRLGGPNRSFHFPGFVSEEELAALFAYSDLFVFPTLADTLPLVILEAMAHGLPVLSTRVGGVPYEVDASCGLLVEPGSATALLDGFVKITSDPVALRTMGESARARVEKEFTWDEAARKALAVYQAIVQEPSRHREGA